MKKHIVLACAALGVLSALGCESQAPSGRRVTELRDGWTLSVNGGPERKVSVPNDWAIAGPFARENPTGGGGGFAPSGVATYTRKIELPEPGARVAHLQFDGVMANPQVFLDGEEIVRRHDGYVSFEIDTHKPAGNHVLVVRADTSAQPASRWYAGAGMFRPARLVVTNPTHVVTGGVLVATPEVDEGSAKVRVSFEVTGPLATGAGVTLRDPAGRAVTSARVGAPSLRGGRQQFDCELSVDRPKLWDIGSGAMYSADIEVRAGAGVVDAVSQPFGIRAARFEAATGFWINGRNVKLKGVCLHGDGGAVGVAVPTAIWERRLQALREIGVNAIRTAHNPPDPAFLDLCDRMGFVVMDEAFDCWRVGKNRYDYHLYFDADAEADLTMTVRRHRNHPSIVVYSAGNEIHDTPNAAAAKEILARLLAVYRREDPTRPVTQALFRPNASHDYDDGLADMLDVVGQNYRERELQAAAEQKPTRKILGTENQHSRAVWLALRDDPRMAGQFLWTGVDYLGEARAWPRFAAGSGLLDRTGAMKPMAYERQSWWSEKPMVYACRRVAPNARAETDPGYNNGPVTATNPREVLFEDWTPANLDRHDETVEVYSNCRSVELLLNGRSLGAQEIRADASPRTWRVPFEPGTLRAVTDKGNAFELRTAGRPAAVKLWCDHEAVGATFDSAAVVRASIVDEDGVVVPSATDAIIFDVTENGQLIAVDNGDLRYADPFVGKSFHACRGKAVAIVRGVTNTDGFTVTAHVEGLPPATWRFATLARRGRLAEE